MNLFDIREGDVSKVLPTLAGQFDACFCDPPYGLSFMGAKWDHGVPSVEVWREVYRLLKPGAMLLAFGGTRTFHRLTCAIEDAGFEIRDCIGFAWCYGSGFPKSLDISKAIDKSRDEDIDPVRAVCRVVRSAMDARSLKSKHLTVYFGNCDPRLIDHWAARDTDSQPSLPTPTQWETLKLLLGLGDGMDSEVSRLNARKGSAGDGWTQSEVLGEHGGEPGGFGKHRFVVRDRAIRAPTVEACRWSGYGTSLKPAFEPIILAMKPTDGTFAQNALKHGVAGLNVDGCRVVGGPSAGGSISGASALGQGAGWNKHNNRTAEIDRSMSAGRWPANLILDEQAAAMLDEHVGDLGKSTGGGMNRDSKSASSYQPGHDKVKTVGHGDSGGASRFFYTAKADADERHLKGMKSERINHPTMKPIDLCAYLAKLLLPPERETPRCLLVPYSGVGSEVIGALRAGWDEVVGIEEDPKWVRISRLRIAGDAPLLNVEAS